MRRKGRLQASAERGGFRVREFSRSSGSVKRESEGSEGRVEVEVEGRSKVK